MRVNLASSFLDGVDGQRTALVTPSGPVSYADLRVLVNRAGNALLDLGVEPGDRVLLALSDGVEFVATWFGAQRIGAITAEVYSYLPAKEYRHYLEYCRPAVVVVDQSTVDRLREAGAANLLVAGLPEAELWAGEHHYDALVAGASPDLAPRDRPADAIAIWKFTTGSTGAPKACQLPARSALSSFQWYGRGVLGLGPEDLVLPVPKLFFGYARDLAALFPFGVGAAGIVFPERSTVDRVFELIARHRPTILVNVPTMMRAMVAHPDAASQDLSSVRLCTSAGEALPTPLHRRWLETFGVEVIDGLGSSEAYHIYISNRPGQVRLGSVGRAVDGYACRVVDQDGQPLPDGEVGRLEITSGAVARGYVGDPRSSQTFPAEDTVRSGDLLSRDAEGYFYYHGRADDLFKVGGRWVAPSEIEQCLLTHPRVADCAVVAHAVDGLSLPLAYVVADGEVSTEELRGFARARLAPHKVPREIRSVPALPRTASGKLDRTGLRSLAESDESPAR